MSSINPATQPRDELNPFTQKVKQFFKPGNDYGLRNYAVRLRNGTLVQPEYKYAEDAFFAEGYRYCWNLDGTSVTSRDYDMMEIVYNA